MHHFQENDIFLNYNIIGTSSVLPPLCKEELKSDNLTMINLKLSVGYADSKSAHGMGVSYKGNSLHY